MVSYFLGDSSVYLFVVEVESLVAKEIVLIQIWINDYQYVFSYILGGKPCQCNSTTDAVRVWLLFKVKSYCEHWISIDYEMKDTQS